MKIVQSCDKVKPKLTSENVPVGTVFKIVGSTHIWLRASGGCLNLTNNEFYKTLTSHYNVDLVYPNARIVLE